MPCKPKRISMGHFPAKPNPDILAYQNDLLVAQRPILSLGFLSLRNTVGALSFAQQRFLSGSVKVADELFRQPQASYSLRFHRFCTGEGCSQRRATLGQFRRVQMLIVGHAVLPTAEENPHPFESQAAHRGVVPVAALPLLLIVSARPWRKGYRVSGPLMEALPRKLGAPPTRVHPLLLAAALHDGCDPAEGLQFTGAPVALPL